jgi:hydroxymethylpyrimidine kinase/phosphomethylpyrimidine kinase
VRIALSIAGSDPTGGAGLQLDLQVFRALGVHGCGVVTALTVQDTAKVHRVLPVFPSVVSDQLRALLRDFTPHAVKIGMLATDDVLRAVHHGLGELEAHAGGQPPIVIDPVLAASDGQPLLERRAWPALVALLEGCALVTPNLPEARALTGRDVSTRQGVETAARSFVLEMGAAAALVTGGHAEGAPDDCLAQRAGDGIEVAWLAGERLASGPVHGTGCALASAVAAHLALGEPLAAAVDGARAFVAEALRRAEAPGQGAGLLRFP